MVETYDSMPQPEADLYFSGWIFFLGFHMLLMNPVEQLEGTMAWMGEVLWVAYVSRGEHVPFALPAGE
jgi:hypothetical protein